MEEQPRFRDEVGEPIALPAIVVSDSFIICKSVSSYFSMIYFDKNKIRSSAQMAIIKIKNETQL